MVVTEIPSVLLARCPGCAQALERKSVPCAHCGLGAAAVPTFWARRDLRDGQLKMNIICGALFAVTSVAIAAELPLVKNPSRALVMAAAGLFALGLVMSALLLLPALRLALARLRKRSQWTYATEWSSDVGHGSVEAQMVLVGGQLTWASGRYLAWGQPRGRRFGARAAPLKSQRRFVRWLMAEVLAGRAHVANRRSIQWELNHPGAASAQRAPRGDGVVRTEEQCLIVTPSAGPGEAASDAIYAAHLSRPRPVAELWIALSREAEKIPQSALGEHEIPDWAHDLEAALTAEVAPLVMN